MAFKMKYQGNGFPFKNDDDKKIIESIETSTISGAETADKMDGEGGRFYVEPGNTKQSIASNIAFAESVDSLKTVNLDRASNIKDLNLRNKTIADIKAGKYRFHLKD